jgi:hypothetical protein
VFGVPAFSAIVKLELQYLVDDCDDVPSDLDFLACCFLTVVAVPFLAGFGAFGGRTVLAFSGAGLFICSPLEGVLCLTVADGVPCLGAEEGAGVPWLEDGGAGGALRARPSLLIFSEMLMGMTSPPGVPSRELVDASFLISFFFEAIVDVEAFGVERTEERGTPDALAAATAAACFALLLASISIARFRVSPDSRYLRDSFALL